MFAARTNDRFEFEHRIETDFLVPIHFQVFHADEFALEWLTFAVEFLRIGR